MKNDDKNPVLDRLIQFIDSTGLSSTQFADKTGIPRPSLSQMLHGRNKSVNNQVLAKLNATFPELNILWLLFGRGDMLQNTNIETSERQNRQLESNIAEQSPEIEETAQYGFSENPNLFYIPNRINTHVKDNADTIHAPKVPNPTIPDNTEKVQNVPNALPDIPTDDGRQISSIIVLYTDGSFETFKPQNS